VELEGLESGSFFLRPRLESFLESSAGTVGEYGLLGLGCRLIFFVFGLAEEALLDFFLGIGIGASD
jgi:hypothetical protein